MSPLSIAGVKGSIVVSFFVLNCIIGRALAIADTVEARQSTTPTFGPGPGWVQVPGCFQDQSGSRAILGPSFTDASGMSPLSCTQFCDSAGGRILGIAGLEFGQECYCGSVLRPEIGVPINSSNCDIPCPLGTFDCGGRSALTVFQFPGRPGPMIRESTFTFNNVWNYLGCFSDGPNRILQVRLNLDPEASIPPEPEFLDAEQCTSTCENHGFTFAGLEFGQECWCGNAINGIPPQLTDDSCRATSCPADNLEACGAPFVIALYQISA
ncbi:hypothetical protein M422DRAFT_52204 [Sphaerobolus stellatus SS14]|uniref:WSC domain-containing protein n=1 Tax=Sphaerobolus stellatus (strain SS14) TaxID=990650 RepID=A0A0C9TUG7_SPHS4|nr:hypothetical protein M422DRAFT_52204 [Sphaerobolus stellatus SS14]